MSTVKEVAGLAVRLLTGTAQTTARYTKPMLGSSCIAVGRAWAELNPDRKLVRARAWDVWADAVFYMHDGTVPEWWDKYSLAPKDIAIRVEALRRWADEHGDEEITV